MPRLLAALRLACLALLLPLLGACHSGPLGHPVIVGASASAGLGSQISTPDGKVYIADMQAVYDAAVIDGHDTLFLADAAFFADPNAAASRQLSKASESDPSVLVGIDFLFWPVYAIHDVSPAALEARRRSLRSALAALEPFSCPMILGDIPDMHAAIGTQLAPDMVPSFDDLTQLNRDLAQWAAARPNVVLVPLAALSASARDHTSFTIGDETYLGDRAARLIQSDHLHPTTEGLVVMLLAGLDELRARGVIRPDSYRSNPADLFARLPEAARGVDNARREGGIFTLLSIKGEADDLKAAVDARDCKTASAKFETLMDQVSHLRGRIEGGADFEATLLLDMYTFGCDEGPARVLAWRRRLEPQIEVTTPDPWLLRLWAELANVTEGQGAIIARVVRLQHDLGKVPDEYQPVRQDAIRFALKRDHEALFRIVPDPRPGLQRLFERSANHVLSLATDGDSESNRSLRHSLWVGRKELDSFFAQHKNIVPGGDLTKPSTPEEDAEQMVSIERLQHSALESLAKDVAQWEMACRDVGRDKDAAWIESVIKTMVTEQMWADAKAQAQKTAALYAGKATPEPGPPDQPARP